MEKTIKFIIIAIIGGSCFSLLFLYSLGVIPGFESNPFNTDNSNNDDGITGRSTALSEVHNITLTVEYVSQPKKTWENISLYHHDTSVLDALEEKCEVKTKEYSYGVLVIGIDGVEGDWIYYVNDKYAGVGAQAYYLSNGDDIYWKHVNV